MAAIRIAVDVTYELAGWVFDAIKRASWERAVNRAYFRLKC